MANFVLVPGAWQEAWRYRDASKTLRPAGHTVVTSTHSGVDERAHQSADNVTLETEIRDVIGSIETKELEDVIPYGHSDDSRVDGRQALAAELQKLA